MSPKIMKIRAVYRVSTGDEIELLNEDNMPGAGRRFNDAPGPVTALLVGPDQEYLRALPTPDAADTLGLIVYRYPLEDISAAHPGELEIPERFHQYLVDGICSFAYLKQDAETFNPTKSNEAQERFFFYCDEYKRERELREHKPRGVEYGGY